MKNLLTISFLFVASSAVCAATAYVITNDNNENGNTSTAYALDTTTGDLVQMGVLQTGGRGMGMINNAVGLQEQAITRNANCIFVMDGLTSDIASFSARTHYAIVGNYSNSALDANFLGGGMVLTPNDRFLYAVYTKSDNLGAWAINADCSLSLIAIYPGLGWPLMVTPNGAGLVATGLTGTQTLAIDSTTGALTVVGNLLIQCGGGECYPTGIDFTKDNKYVVLSANYQTQYGTVPMAWTAGLTSKGLVHAQGWRLNPGKLDNNNFPFLSAAAYGGAGYLYFGASGDGGCGSAGIIATHFTENPLNIGIANTTIINSPNCLVNGSIAVVGNLMIVAEFPNQIGVFSINADGWLTPLSTTIDENATAMFSLSVFPETR